MVHTIVVLVFYFICALSSDSFRIVINTPSGQFVQAYESFNHGINIYSLSQGLVRDAITYNLINALSVNPNCVYGEMIEGSCECSAGWIGKNCSIHVHYVQNISIQFMLHPVQYFMVKSPINQISVNWDTNKIFLVNSTTGEQMQEIKFTNRFIYLNGNKSNVYKVIGDIGDVVFFNKSMVYLSNYFYLAGFSPFIIYSSIYMVKKLRSKRKMYNKFSILGNTVNNDQDCSICLLNQPNDDKIVLKCQHSFHKACLEDWLKINETCPYCRYNVLEDQQSINI